jgi:hypothetical protein
MNNGLIVALFVSLSHFSLVQSLRVVRNDRQLTYTHTHTVALRAVAAKRDV